MSIAQRRAEAVLTDGRIELAMPYRLKEVVKSLPGARWDPRRRLWHVPATPAAAKAAVEILTPHGVEVGPDVLALAEQGEAGTAIKNAQPGELEAIPATKTRPWHHQVIGYHLIVTQPATLLAWEMGVGKSKAVVDAACNLDGCRPQTTARDLEG